MGTLFCLLALLKQWISKHSIFVEEKERGQERWKADKQVSSFRRKGTLPFLLIVGKADFKKKPAAMVISGSKGNSKATEARAAKPCCVPITRFRSMNGWPGLLLAGTHLVPPDLRICLGASGDELPRTLLPLLWKTRAVLSNRWGGVCAGEHGHWVEEERPRDDRFGGNLL